VPGALVWEVAMARVEVFVDDAVRGRLPNVCVKTGERADGKFRIEQSWGGVGAGWLLVLLGPLGWIALAVWATAARRDVLTVRLPYCTAAFEREIRLSRERLVAAVVAIVLGFAALVQLASVPRSVWVAATVTAVVVAAVVHARLSWTQVGIRLDASRRWIRLSNVHPAFAEAVNASCDVDELRNAID
jgi:hypothetical protein